MALKTLNRFEGDLTLRMAKVDRIHTFHSKAKSELKVAKLSYLYAFEDLSGQTYTWTTSDPKLLGSVVKGRDSWVGRAPVHIVADIKARATVTQLTHCKVTFL